MGTDVEHKSDKILLRIFTLSWRGLMLIHQVLHACFAGFWLGVLNRKLLHQIDRYYYNNTKKYRDKDYNRTGLFDWERYAVQQYFLDCKKLILYGAGGGREVLALAKLGFEVDGYECNPLLVEAAQSLLESETLDATVSIFPRDRCPVGMGNFDGVIIGWGTYMLIQGRQTRTSFLKDLRALLKPNAPILISFFHRKQNNLGFKLILTITNALRFLLFQEKAEIGDELVPNFVHYFTGDEIASELLEGGFELKKYCEKPYGHAIGIAK